jgi:hypothetical protein
MQRRMAQRPYVRLRPLAYVTGSEPRGSIGSPPEQGAEVYWVWPGHVMAPDPRLALSKAWVSFVPESQDPAESGLGPTQRGPGPVPRVRRHLSAFRDRGSLGPTSECRCVPQPRWVERVGEREGGKERGGRRPA